MFQYKALRIVTNDGKEYLFEFQKAKHAQKALEVLIGTENASKLLKRVSEESKPCLCKNASIDILINPAKYKEYWQ